MVDYDEVAALEDWKQSPFYEEPRSKTNTPNDEQRHFQQDRRVE